MKNKYIMPVIALAALLILSLVTTASYAYFSANIRGNTSASSNVITSGHMEVTFEDGNVIGVANNMIPGDYIKKAFSVTNTGTVDTLYNIYLNDVINTFNTKDDLVYELISEDGENINETICPDTNTKIASAVEIGVGQTHNYILKIIFKNVNRNQDDNKGSIFSSKIDLEEKDNDVFLSDRLLSLKKSDAIDLEYDGFEALGEYGTADNNLRYVGASPNNYIYFNCSTKNPNEMNDETCEKWRIIGLFNNLKDENGNIVSRVKIIKSDSLGKYSWDTCGRYGNVGEGVNQWGETIDESGNAYEGADLMRELNYDYLGNVIVGTNGKWYNGRSNVKTANMPDSFLNENTSFMIESIEWSTGAYASGTVSNSYSLYNDERGVVNGRICQSNHELEDNCGDNVQRTIKWTGKIALPYPSDYGFSVSVGGDFSRKECLNTKYYLLKDNENCINNMWLKKEATYWTLMPYSSTISSYNVASIKADGSFLGSIAKDANDVYPTLYLKSNIMIVSGDGSSIAPYKLVM